MAKKKRTEPETYIFDTYRYVKDFQSAGFNEKQAEMIVGSLLKSRDSDLSHLASKEQVNALDNKINTLDNKISTLDNKIDFLEKSTKEQINTLDNKINALEKSTKEQIETAVARLEASMIKWMVGFMITFSSIIIAAFKLIK